MQKNLSWFPLLVASSILVAACSSPDGGPDDPIDVDGGSVVDGGTQDTGTPDSGPPVCTETLPTGQIFGDRTATEEQSTFLGDIVVLPDGRVMVGGYNGLTGIQSRIWSGSQWTNAQISASAASITYGSPVFGAFGDKFVAFISAKYPSDPTNATVHLFPETTPGAFGAMQDTVTSGPFYLADRPIAYLSDLHRMGVALRASAGGTIHFLEKSDGAPWHLDNVVAPPAGTTYSPIVSGYNTDGTAFMVARRTTSGSTTFVLMRRTGSAWSEVKTLYTTTANLYNFAAVISPEGAAQRRVQIAWEEFTSTPPTGTIRTLAVDPSTLEVSAPATLLSVPVSVQNYIFAELAFSADGKRTLYAIVDRGTQQAWLGSSVNGGAFTTAKPYHPELSTNGLITPFFSRCGKAMIAHRTYPTGGSASARYTIDAVTDQEVGQ